MSSGPSEHARYVGAIMREIWQWVRDQIYTGVVEAGYGDLNPAHVALFRWPRLDGQRPSELAAQHQITKQSVNDLVRHLEERGYLVRKPDPDDGRARILCLTAKGRRLGRLINEQAGDAEARIAAALGPRRFAGFREALEELADTLGRPTSPS